MDNNPYQAPGAHVAEAADEQLAGRGERLLAAIIDGIIMVAIVLPVMFATGYFTRIQNGDTPAISVTIGYAIAGFLIFLIVQGYPLAKSAQTWGKKVLGIRIALLDGTQPTFGTIVLKRYLPVQVVGSVPLIGPLLSIVDVLLIFRSDRRCAHDLIAGTQVLKG
ncbi:RDD family domain-containing protein [Lysobacter dokdonensis DS-58]|uniref:RDD family domain-containing protein n=1 Tax=Lysobacter dokdonensis DS-58 TaxID=1300345 RepID=A0A0A2WNW3_9GAMM|nr:RDD family protein [Lysobacter dokdonensis]KGQ19980.1 RDD family domain-containing protein [Lysobacter dokdonensis DS-58]